MKKVILIFILVLMLLPREVSAETEEEIMSTTQEKFNISGFVEQAEQYMGESFGEIKLKDILNQAIQGKIDNQSLYKNIIKLLGEEISSSLKILISILVIIVIHGILKSITDNLENTSVSQIIYFVQYILIVTLIMSNFTEIIKIVKETANNLVGFINVLIPLLLTLLVYTGNIATSTLLQPIILFISNFVGNIIADVLIPIVLIIVVFSIISKISEKVQVDKISKFLKSGVVWFLGVVLTIFVSVVSIEGTLSIIYSLASAVIQPVADEKIVKLLDEMGGVFKLLLGILCALSVLLIIGVTMVVKISNSGMMYR